MISIETLVAVLSFGIACFQVGYSLGSRKVYTTDKNGVEHVYAGNQTIYLEGVIKKVTLTSTSITCPFALFFTRKVPLPSYLNFGGMEGDYSIVFVTLEGD